MNVGSWPHRPARLAVLILLLVILLPGPAHCIDNPDAPDLKSDFVERSRKFQELIDNEAVNHRRRQFSADYAAFLNNELNAVYSQLNKQLGRESNSALRASQRQWLAFRDAEREFITRTWIRDNFGSSFDLSREDYNNAIMRQRIEMLYDYLRNFSPLPR